VDWAPDLRLGAWYVYTYVYIYIHRVWLSTWSGGFDLENSEAHVINETRHSSIYACLCRELDQELRHLVKGYDAYVLGRLVKG
jgi:hypothetical protein